MIPVGMSWRRTPRFGIGQLLLLSSLFFVSASSRLVNITVDDTFGDPTTGSFPEYLPNNGTWNAGSPAGSCPSCYIGPSILDLTQIHNETWHDTTYLPWETPATITVRFNGSAVYVYNILPNTLANTITLANISFSIDGKDVGSFIRSPDSGTTVLYNQLVYHNTTLNEGPHTLAMTAGSNSLVLFDYLVYTTESDDTTPSASATSTNVTSTNVTSTNVTSTNTAQSSSSSAPVGAVVGGVVGGVVLLGAAIGAFFLYRKHTRSKSTLTTVHAYTYDNSGGGSDRKYRVPPPPTPMNPTSPGDPIVRSLHGAMAHSLSHLASRNASGPDTPPSLVIAGTPSPSTAEWSSRRRAELTQRLEALQHTRTVLSSQVPLSPSRSEVSSESRTEAAIRELEVEISQLRGVMSALNARLGDGHGHHLDPLPEYVE